LILKVAGQLSLVLSQGKAKFINGFVSEQIGDLSFGLITPTRLINNTLINITNTSITTHFTVETVGIFNMPVKYYML